MTELIGEIFDPAETAVAAFETEEDGPWLLEAYFAREPDEAAIRDLVRPIVGAEADKGVFLPLEQQDWVKASLEGLNPVRAGRVLVHGSHDREQVAPTMSPSRSRLRLPSARAITAPPRAAFWPSWTS